MSATAITAPTQVISVASTQIAAAAQTSTPRVEPITQAKKSADPLVQKYADSVQKSDAPISAQASPHASPSTAKQYLLPLQLLHAKPHLKVPM